MGYLTFKNWNNKREPLPVQFVAYKCNFLWPLEEDSSDWQFILQYAGIVISLLAYIGTVIGELTFLATNAHDIPSMTDCLSTTLMGIQYSIRISLMAGRQAEIRSIFRRFYREIYFTNADEAKFHRAVQNYMRLPDLFTRFYYAPMFLIIVLFLYDATRFDMAADNKPYIYRMTFSLYNAQEPLAYILTSIYTTWLSFSCVSLMSAEDFSICLMLCHTSYRFKQLREDLKNLYKDSIIGMTANPEAVHAAYSRRLNAILRRQHQLNSFVKEAKSHFTYMIFFFLMFGTLSICVVSFQFQRTQVGLIWIKYVVWLISQTSQFIVLGYFGQMLTDSTTELKHSFYMCGWENILTFGSVHMNKVLMGDIRLAIMYAQKEIVFDGFKMVSLTIGTVEAALRAAMSYFMFLNTMADGKKSL